MDEKRYINNDNPVYFSYAWANDEHPDIEEDVNELCRLLKENNIYYKRDKADDENCLCPYRWSIKKSEKEIGEGSTIIVVISERYLKSLHCMYEWHLICKNGRIAERVFPIVLEDAQITKDDVYYTFYNHFQEQKAKIETKIHEDKMRVTGVEKETVGAGFFIDDYKNLYQYLAEYNTSKVSLLKKERYKLTIDQLKKHFERISEKVNKNIHNSNTGHYTFYVPDGFVIEIHKGSLKDNPGCQFIEPNTYLCFK